jgi:hypothetical protein
MRTITIYSTSGQDGKIISSNAKTWGELQGVLTENGVSHKNMKAVIGENRHTLEVANAELPSDKFTLFLMPIKVKSGMDVDKMSYKDLRSAIKETIAENKEAAEHFNKDKNYTNKSTDEMKNLLKAWLNKMTGKSETKKSEEKPKKTEKPKKVKEEVTEEVTEEVIDEVIEKAVEKTTAEPIDLEPIKTAISFLNDAEKLLNDFIAKHPGEPAIQESAIITAEQKKKLKDDAERIKREFGL